MKRLLLIFLGCCTFVLGTLGIFLPLLPTTGFYLLTAFFWMRSSDKLYHKFLASSYYQKYIQTAFIEKKITRQGKLKVFFSMFLLFAIPCLLVRNTLMTVTLVAVYIAHVIGLSWYWRPKKDIEIKPDAEV
ncbi:YbaN family protein [Enterococcus faecalis]